MGLVREKLSVERACRRLCLKKGHQILLRGDNLSLLNPSTPSPASFPNMVVRSTSGILRPPEATAVLEVFFFFNLLRFFKSTWDLLLNYLKKQTNRSEATRLYADNYKAFLSQKRSCF
ncbi:UNVERIFIED_CONTAM: hypothetical protein K2H54_057904 [Gekko kuhli]